MAKATDNNTNKTCSNLTRAFRKWLYLYLDNAMLEKTPLAASSMAS
jgi:hypothetical protein